MGVYNATYTQPEGGTTHLHVDDEDIESYSYSAHTEDGTAEAGKDYTEATYSGSGTAPVNIDVGSLDDDVWEGPKPETFFIKGSADIVSEDDDGNLVSEHWTGTLTFEIDDHEDKPKISIGSVLSEGSPVALEISATHSCTEPYTIHVHIDDSAAPFEQTDFNVEMPAFETQAHITLVPKLDQFPVEPSSYTISATADAFGESLDVSSGQVDLSGIVVTLSDAAANEDTGELAFTVSLSRAFDSGALVISPLIASLNAQPDVLKYSNANPLTEDIQGLATIAVTFNPGETEKTLTVPVRADGLAEPDEVFSFKIGMSTNTTGAEVSFSDDTGIGTILNDDGDPTSAVVTFTNGGFDTELVDLLKQDIQAAVTRIEQQLGSNNVPDLEIAVLNELATSARASARPVYSQALKLANGSVIELPNAIYENLFSDDPNGSSPDLTIFLDTAKVKSFYSGKSDEDVTTLLTHEILHGLGFGHRESRADHVTPWELMTSDFEFFRGTQVDDEMVKLWPTDPGHLDAFGALMSPGSFGPNTSMSSVEISIMRDLGFGSFNPQWLPPAGSYELVAGRDSSPSSKLTDGYIVNATIFADANSNDVFDSGEPSTTTDGAGAFTPIPAFGRLIATGGSDIATGLPFKGHLSAPVGSTTITPLTTLIVTLAKLGIADAESKVLVAFGFDPTTNLTTLDPIAGTSDGNAQAALAFTAGIEVFDTMTLLTSLLAGNNPANYGGAFDAILDALADLIVAHGAGLDLTDQSQVKEIINAVLAMGSFTLDPAKIDGVAAISAALNQAVEDAGGASGVDLLSALSAISLVAQGAAADAVKEVGDGTANIADALDAFTGDNLADAINAAKSQIGDVDGPDIQSAPTANLDMLITDEDTALAGSVLTNDSDPDGDALVVSAINGSAANVGSQIVLASGALLTVGADGALGYDPNGAFAALNTGETATDSFAYTISDGHGGTDTATATVTISGIGGGGPPTCPTVDRPGTQDGSASTDDTLTGPPYHNTFFVAEAGVSGHDRITNFAKDDVFATSKALFDSNGDGIITFGTNKVLDLDGPDAGIDTVKFDGLDAKRGLRFLGEGCDDVFVYADATVRPSKALEGRLGDDSLTGDNPDAKTNTFFFDTALDLNLGHDKITNFGGKDILVTTTKLFDSNADNKVDFGPNHLLDLSGGLGGPGDPGLPGEVGNLDIKNTAGHAVTTVEFDGQVDHGGVHYYVYSTVGSAAGTGDLFPEPGTGEETEVGSPGVLALVGIDSNSFAPLGQPLAFDVSGASIDAGPGLLVYRNDVLIDPSHYSVSPDGTRLTITEPLVEGSNHIEVYATDKQGFQLAADQVLWAGGNSLTVLVVDESGQPVAGATVVAKLTEDQSIMASGTTNPDGNVVFSNLPNRNISIESTLGDLFGSLGTLGGSGTTALILSDFDMASSVDNNDFSLGLEGWNIGSAPVSLIPHVEPSANLETSAAAGLAEFAPGYGHTRSYQASLLSSSDANSQDVTPAAEGDDIDLRLSTSGEGEQSISRTFTIEPGTESVTVRFQFITSEVPGGYFGTEFNDYYRVTIRSQEGGGVISESNSMNGLGLGAFDASGATAFREVTLTTAEEGDTVQVEVAVANVADDLLDSQVVVDLVEEAQLAVTALDLNDIDNSDLRFLSADAENPYFGGNTRIHGTITIEGPEDDSLSNVVLEIVSGGSVVATASLSAAARAALVGHAFGADETISLNASSLMFELPIGQAANVPTGADGTVSLRVKATAASGDEATKDYGAVQVLDLYTGASRYGLDRDADEGGDAWGLPSTIDLIEHFDDRITVNDVSNMNGGKFPPHITHRDGTHLDGRYAGYEARDAAAAHTMINLLNDKPYGKHIHTVWVTYNAPFFDAINGVTLDDGRLATNVIDPEPGHTDHFHWVLV
ncbi:MAG: hypothetical protein E5Y73_25190 [Mesorhizobium sp.]|uniref:Ig-like domain-containing protein n=1 Tax=Mesorhizobium sp. TaxID=1871066 RepID=UPI0011FC651E|nr:Ig-like domain-containing protein [Mesorhizobium sp.]TIL87507.1 MAG: hypothetical protein E5Y73_25190 [Mesorhizobium sp.]